MKTIARIVLVLSPLALGACVSVERQPAQQPASTTVVVPPNSAPTTTVVCTTGAPPPCM
jgi:hypothetical protein